MTFTLRDATFCSSTVGLLEGGWGGGGRGFIKKPTIEWDVEEGINQ